MSEQPKSFFADLSDKHERLKKRIHNFRMPLGPFGRFVMSIIYFTVPILGGYYFLPYIDKIKDKNLEGIEKRTVNHETFEQNRALQRILDDAAHKKSP